MSNTHFSDEIASEIEQDSGLSDDVKKKIYANLQALKNTKVNILITGPTGCGKSSTINAIFNQEKAKIGQDSDPETMDITKYEFNNIILFDSPGLGDGKEADIRHSKNIKDKLHEKDASGNLLIDLVLVIIDGSTRDLGTSFDLINNIIIPNLGSDKKRLLIAINQADMAMKGRYWNKKENIPESELVEFLDKQVISIKNRIKASTGVDIDPIYYSAGFKEKDKSQVPYNLSKLLLFILRHTKPEKRAVFIDDINKDKTAWEKNDKSEDYQKEIKKTLLESVLESASKGADIGEEIGGKFFGEKGKTIGKIGGAIIGGIFGLFS